MPTNPTLIQSSFPTNPTNNPTLEPTKQPTEDETHENTTSGDGSLTSCVYYT